MRKSYLFKVNVKVVFKKLGKGFCLSVAHNSVNKCLSESAIIQMYSTAYRGIYNHHLVQEESCKELYALPKEKTILAPQQCCLNKNNIIKYEKVISKPIKRTLIQNISSSRKHHIGALCMTAFKNFQLSIMICFFKL